MARKTRTDGGGDMLLGTLDMLILRTVLPGAAHGHTIAHIIEKSSDEALQVEHGSLYPALHRLEDQGLIASFWGTSENNRKAKYYRITPEGQTAPGAGTQPVGVAGAGRDARAGPGDGVMP